MKLSLICFLWTTIGKEFDRAANSAVKESEIHEGISCETSVAHSSVQV